MTAFYVLLISAGLTVVDQLLKLLVYNTLRMSGVVPLIPGIFELRYTENTGGAFSIFSGQTFILSIITIAVIVVLIVILIKGAVTNKFALLSMALIIGGGIGNLIDRIFRGSVIDYLYFSLINFPIFNFADITLVCGEIILAVYILFYHDKKKKIIVH